MNDAQMNKVRHRLLHRIRRQFQVVSEQVRIGPLSFPFTRIADPDKVLDDVAAEADLRDRLAGKPAPGDELHLPYWAEVWESAKGVGEFLVSEECRVKSEEWDEQMQSAECKVQNERFVAGAPLFTLHSSLFTSSVLDLGCGMGMAGMVAAALGARVMFADLEPPALLFARLNSLPSRDRVRTRRLNWQRDRLDEKFDLILGADILYERAQWPFLNAFWRAHLARGGAIVLGEPGRQTGDLFIEWIGGMGWSLVRHETPVQGRERPIRVFQLRSLQVTESEVGPARRAGLGCGAPVHPLRG